MSELYLEGLSDMVNQTAPKKKKAVVPPPVGEAKRQKNPVDLILRYRDGGVGLDILHDYDMADAKFVDDSMDVLILSLALGRILSRYTNVSEHEAVARISMAVLEMGKDSGALSQSSIENFKKEYKAKWE